MDINKLIIQLREEKGLSTTKLAKLAGIAQSTLREIELGNTSPTWDTINKLCLALEVSPLALLSEFYSNPLEDELLSPEVNQVLEKIKRMSPRQLNILNSVLDEWKIEEQKNLKSIQPKSNEYIPSTSLKIQIRETVEEKLQLKNKKNFNTFSNK